MEIISGLVVLAAFVAIFGVLYEAWVWNNRK